MYDDLQPDTCNRLRQLQLVALAMGAGVVSFAAIAWFLSQGGSGGASNSSSVIGMLRTIAVALLVCGGMFGIIFRALAVKSAERSLADRAADEQEQAAFGYFFTATLIACALLEGPALLFVVLHLMDHQLLDLGLAMIPIALLLVLHFPTEERFRFFKRSVLEAPNRSQ